MMTILKIQAAYSILRRQKGMLGKQINILSPCSRYLRLFTSLIMTESCTPELSAEIPQLGSTGYTHTHMSTLTHTDPGAQKRNPRANKLLLHVY